MSRLGKTFTLALVLTLSVSALFTLNISDVDAQTAQFEITIMEDGSVNPSNVPIQREGNVYTLTADFFGSIMIKCSGVTVDGAGHALIGYNSENSFGLFVYRQQNYINLKNMEVKGFTTNIGFDGASNSTIYNCKITDCNHLYSLIIGGSNNTVSGNQIVGSYETGILVHSTGTGNIIANNYIANHARYGIEFEPNSQTTLRNNTLENNTMPFHFNEGDNLQKNIDASNIVDGKPVCYWINQQDRTVPTDSGYTYLVNCSKITVKGLSIYDASNIPKSNSNGIHLIDTVDSVIINNNLMAGSGISVSGSATKNVTICQNNLGTTVSVFNCIVVNNLFVKGGNLLVDNSTVSLNRIDSCDHGITISDGNDNQIFQNTITNCNVGIFIHKAVGNRLFHNNFINNNQSFFEDHNEVIWGFNGYSYSVNNTWDNNYWSGYSGVDLDGNGVGDTPYLIFENMTDNLPLMHEFETSNSLPTSTPNQTSMTDNKTLIDKFGTSNSLQTPTLISVANIASVFIVVAVCVSLIVYFKKRKR